MGQLWRLNNLCETLSQDLAHAKHSGEVSLFCNQYLVVMSVYLAPLYFDMYLTLCLSKGILSDL